MAPSPTLRPVQAPSRLIPALMVFAHVAGCSGGGEPPVVMLKGVPIRVEWFRSDPARRYAPVDHGRLSERYGMLVGYTHDRFQHFFSLRSSAAFDVAFLDGAGKIVEVRALKANDIDGLTSTKECRYALFLEEGWLARHNVSEGEQAALGAGIVASPPDPFPEIRIGGVPLKVEVSVLHAERNRGLMYRKALSFDDGMLFAYAAERPDVEFYMLNCYFPLDIAFFDAKGKFINVVPTDPYPDPRVDTNERSRPTRNAQFIVETRKGWFRAKGLVDEKGEPTKDLQLEMPPDVREYVRKAQ